MAIQKWKPAHREVWIKCLEAPEGVRFMIRSRVLSPEELAALS